MELTQTTTMLQIITYKAMFEHSSNKNAKQTIVEIKDVYKKKTQNQTVQSEYW